MTYEPGDPNRPFEFPPLEQSSPQANPYAPIDYPSVQPSYPPPAPGYGPPPFPAPYQGYGTDPYDPYRTGRPPGTNGVAVAALVVSLAGLMFTCGFTSPVSLILGIVAMRDTKRTGQEGHGMALAAVIISGVTIALWVIVLFAAFLVPLIIFGSVANTG